MINLADVFVFVSEQAYPQASGSLQVIQMHGAGTGSFHSMTIEPGYRHLDYIFIDN